MPITSLTGNIVSEVSKLLNIVLLYISISIALVPLRLLGIFNGAVLDSFIYIFFGAFAFLKILLNKKYVGHPVVWILMFFPIFLMPLGILNGHSVKYVISDALKPLCFFSLVVYFSNLKIDYTNIYNETRFANFVLFVCSTVSVIIVLFLIFLGFPIRPSVSDLSMYLTLCIYIFSDRKLRGYFFTAIIIVGGKLGPLLGLLLSFFICRIFTIDIKKQVRFFIYSVICIYLICIIPLPVYENYLPFYGKISILFSSDFSFDDLLLLDDKLLGGRLAEVTSSLFYYSDYPEMILTGFGVGFEYKYFRAGIYEGLLHGVHFSPVAIITIYGLLFASVFYCYLFYVCVKCVSIFNATNYFFLKSCSLFVLVSFFNSFTSFSIFSVLLFPICIGIVINKGN